MCPSSGHGGGWWVRLKRVLRAWRSQEVQPVLVLVPAALLLLLVLYFFPVLSALGLCAVGAWLYYSTSGTAVWRQLTGGGGGASGRRQRPVGYRRQREPGLRWTPASLLLLMGSYLGKQDPPARAMGRGSRELKERLSRPNPAVPTPARRLSFRETPGLSSRAFLSPRRRYPIHQPQYSMPGSLPTVYFDGYQKKCLLSPKSSLVRSPVTVKIARPDPKISRSPVLDNLLSPGPASPLVQCSPDPCAKETVLNAIRESRKRMNKDEHSTTGGLENKRRRQASSGSRDSSFEYPLPNGTLPSCVSKPDSLKRGLNSHILEDTVNKRSRTSSISSLNSSAINGIAMSSHNAISSSYSSSKVILQKRKRTQNVSAVSSSPSSRSQTPDLSAKKAREESHENSPLSAVQQNKDQTGRFGDTPPSNSSVNSSENGSGGARRKKVLLVYSGRSDQYPLPPPPLVGYSVTSKDFDSEKKASLQRLNKALEDASGSIALSSVPSTVLLSSASSTTATTTLTSSLFSLPTTTAAAALTLPTSSASSNPLLLSLAKMQNEEKLAPAQTVNISASNEKIPTSTSTAPAVSVGNPLTAPSLSAPAVTESSNCVPLPQSNAAQPKLEPPKSTVLQLLAKPLESNSQTGFKPVFPTSVTTPLAVSSTGPSTTSNSVSSANTFKPIFGDQNTQPASTSSTFKPIFGDSTAQPPASSSFAFQMNSTSSAASSLFSAFGAKSTNTTVSTESATRPSLAPPTSNSSSTTNTFTASLFSAATSASGSNPAPVNSFPASNAPSDSQAKQFVFGQTPTSQATSGLNMFSSTQSAPTTAPQPQQPSLFGSNTSAFTATISSNAPAFPTNSGTSAFNSTSGSGVQAENPAQNSSVNFGSSGTQPTFGTTGTQPAFGSTSQPTFGANSQPAFGGNTTFAFGNSTPAAAKVTFGNMNSTQTNSTPATNIFGTKPFTFGENSNSVSTFGTPNATPAPAFGNSLAQNNSAITNPSAPLNFGTPAPTENKLAFGSQFGQNSPAGSLPFATSTPSFASPGTFGQGTPGSFSIGLISKPAGSRQRVMARRQHPRKK
ncbi:nuclear envelope pore membrane protein POM 121 isoform X2 [Aquarana catesbeiana]|uniref:nuclear envelope pore membrane protein POM 121 isoform X2 n=1 Tax=Aquarana catesbeiana TaxID=8400 RepID=UPI003CCA3D52